MSTFDELMYQLNDEDEDDTFESELLSLIDDDYDFYSEADNDDESAEVAKNTYDKAKKIKKACIIALGILATIIAGVAVYKKVQKNKIKRDAYQQAGLSKKKKKETSKHKLIDDDMSAEKALKAFKDAEALKSTLGQDLKLLEGQLNKYNKKWSNAERKAWIHVVNDNIDRCMSTLKKVIDLGGYCQDEFKGVASATNRLNEIIAHDRVSRHELRKVSRFNTSFATGESGDTVVSEYDDFMENAVTEYLDNNISFTELCALSAKALQKFDDSSYYESAYDDEYSRVVDSICEKYNANKIDADETVVLLEKAAEKYLDI
jgi:exonuclease VII small subunit